MKRMPTVTFDGATYSLRSSKTIVPDLAAMNRFDALRWLITYTYARGYSRSAVQLPPINVSTR